MKKWFFACVGVVACAAASFAGQEPPAAQTPPSNETPPAAQRAVENGALNRGQQSIVLEHLFGAELEAALSKMLGRRIPMTYDADRDEATLTVSGVEGAAVRLHIQRRGPRVVVEGTPRAAFAWTRIVRALDQKPQERQVTRVVPTRARSAPQLHFAMQRLQENGVVRGAGDNATFVKPLNGDRPGPADLLARFFQPGFRLDEDDLDDEPLDDDLEEAPEDEPLEPGPGEQIEIPAGPGTGLIGPVRIEFVPGLDAIILTGNPRDVERVIQIIDDIEASMAETEPQIEVYQLKHVDSIPMADLVIQVYDQVLSPRQGPVSITPLVKPNALLLIGRADSVRAVIDLIERLDQPVQPLTQFRVFALRHIPAADAAAAVNTFYEGRASLGPRVRVQADFRSNSLIVSASPRDLVEVGKMLEQIDVSDNEVENEVRIFRLRNSLATELAPIIQAAVTNQQAIGTGGAFGQGGALQPLPEVSARSTRLVLQVLDAENKRLLRTGILSEVRVSADARANALVVSAPSECMDLIAALIEQLDRLPDAEALVKVFTIVNGDATQLATMLSQLFGGAAGGQGGFGQQQLGTLGFAIAGSAGETSLVPLRFSVDPRTNSIVASGSSADLGVVEAILLRLDDSDVRQRQSIVYRLLNAPALDVSNAINQFLTSERAVQGLIQNSPFEQLEREVVVVPEPVSNSLIISATPRFFNEIRQIVEALDARPPMVLIQVLIAEVTLNEIDEFGLELGVQDTLLFDRGVVTDIVDPGFNFNNQPLGNSSDPASLATRRKLLGQGLTNFALGRTNPQLGYGGLVLSASSDAISILLRALQESRRTDVLSRPQVMTLDNQPAFIQVGSRVPRITSTQLTNQGTINNTVLENVGILLGVTPRISPDGLVVMEIDAEKSELGPESEGIPISINENGDVIRSPIILTTTAQTTVSAGSGQTVILGGLITKNSSRVDRGLPYLSNIPVLRDVFGYQGYVERRTELLIVMTPYIVRDESDMQWLKQVETDRMNWCVCDIIEIHNDLGVYGPGVQMGHPYTRTIYPDYDPTGKEEINPLLLAPGATQGPRQVTPILPTPAGAPLQPGAVPPMQPTPAPNPNLPPGAPTPELPPAGPLSIPMFVPQDSSSSIPRGMPPTNYTSEAWNGPRAGAPAHAQAPTAPAGELRSALRPPRPHETPTIAPAQPIPNPNSNPRDDGHEESSRRGFAPAIGPSAPPDLLPAGEARAAWNAPSHPSPHQYIEPSHWQSAAPPAAGPQPIYPPPHTPQQQPPPRQQQQPFNHPAHSPHYSAPPHDLQRAPAPGEWGYAPSSARPANVEEGGRTW